MAAQATLGSRSRRELATEVARLRAGGLYHREVAERLGISRSYAADLANDPDGSKTRARKDSYRGVCESCGALTDGSNGPAKAPKLCAACFHERQREELTYSCEYMIGQIRLYHDRYGEVPSTASFSPGLALSIVTKVSPAKRGRYIEMARRYWDDGGYPSPSTYVEKFGSFPAALIAAGFAPHARTPNFGVPDEELLRRMRTLASELGQTPSMREWDKTDAGFSANGAAKRFGSWRNFQHAAGLRPNKAQPRKLR